MLALFCALSAVGAKFPIYGSIALDSLPAFLAAILLGGPEGAIIGAMGHMLSALLSGFPLTIPLHLVIASEMAAICFVTGWLVNERHLPIWAAAIVTFVLNAFVSPLILIAWPGMGWGVCLTLLLPLVIGSAVNAAAAAALGYALKKPLKFVLGAVK